VTNPRISKTNQWKGFIGFQTISNMFEVVFYRQSFYILLRGQFLGDVPFNHNFHIPSFTLQKLRDMNMGDVCGFNFHLVWLPCLNPPFHTKSTFKKGDFVRFWISMDWDNGVWPMLSI
jgi:hypothetical protein